MKRKHSEITKERYPTNCEICHEQLKTCSEMKKYLQQHFYKKATCVQIVTFLGEMNKQWKCTLEILIQLYLNVAYVNMKLIIWKPLKLNFSHVKIIVDKR